jgi:hypothetical protein
MEGLGKIPYVSGWAVFAASFIFLYIIGAFLPPLQNILNGLSNGIASTLPVNAFTMKITNNGLLGVLFVSGILTVVLKVLDAPKPHLYTHGAKGPMERRFEREYGHAPASRGPYKGSGAYVYGAVVGKVKRERAARRRR